MPRRKVTEQQFTPEQVITAIKASDGVVTNAARKLKCSTATIRNYVKRYDVVAEALRESREATLDTAESTIFQAARNGNIEASKFILRHLGRERGYGNNPPPLQLSEPFKLEVVRVDNRKDAEEFPDLSGGLYESQKPSGFQRNPF